MAFGNGPRIVTDNLIIALDAGDRNSYPGSGTTWNDLSGNNCSGSLINGPTYINNSGGGISFDGVDDYSHTMPVPNLSTASMEGNITYEYWVQPTQAIYGSFSQSTIGSAFFTPGTVNGLSSNVNYKYCESGIVGCPTAGYASFLFALGTNGFVAAAHQTSFAPPILVDYKPITGINHLVVIKRSTNCSYYLNGQFQKTSSTSSKILGDGLGYFVSSSGAISYGDNYFTSNRSIYFGLYFKGQIYSYRVYTKELTVSEILQNYNATKTRFGL